MPDQIHSTRPPGPAGAEALYWLLAENTTDIIVRIGMDGVLLYVSPSCRALGYVPEELIGQPSRLVVHPDDQARLAANNAALFSGAPIDRAADRVIRYRAKDGQWVWLEGNPQLICDEAGRPIEVLNALRDVTARKRAELALEQAHAREQRQAERMALAIGAARIGIWEWDLAANTLRWDARMYELYGWVEDGAPSASDILQAAMHPDDRDRIANERRAAMAGQADFDTEFRVFNRDGDLRHLRARATIVRGADGALQSVVGVNWDITATRALEASLRASTTQMRNVIDNANEAIVSFDQTGQITDWNRHAEITFGWTAAEALGQPVAALIIPARDHPALRERLAGFLGHDDGSIVDRRLELTALRKTGEEFPIELAANAIAGAAGWEVTALMHDISERKAQTALFENAFHHAPIGMALVGLEGGFLKVNEALCRIVGYSEPEMLALGFQAITHPDDLEGDLGLLAQLLAGDIHNYQMDKRYVRADGVIVWVRLSVSMVAEADGRPKHFVAQVEDLTARREVEDRYRLLADHATDLILRLDPAGIIQYASPACRQFGYEPSDLVGRARFDLIHPDDAKRMREALERLAAGKGRDKDRRQHRFRHKDGHWVWLEGNPSIIRDETGGVIGMVALLRDITQRLAGDAALAESESRYRLLTANATDVIACYGVDGVFTFLSPSLLSIMGYEPHELVGKPVSTYMHPDDVRPILRKFTAYLAAGPGADPVRFEYRAYRKDGAMVWLEAQAKAIYDEAGQVVEFQDVVRDVTARVALDDELRAARDAAEHAAAVKSDFMANMSHEIRTPLTAILGFTRLLSHRQDLDAVAAAHVARVAGAGQALLSIVNDILDFSKLEAGQVEISPRPVDPAEMLHEALLLFSPQADAKGLTLAFVGHDLPARVAIDPDRVRQILLNLVGNAIKFTDAGEVRLVAAYDDGAQQLNIRVEDTGAGLSPAQQDKLFQRFSQVDASSTRRHGGTGLGLAICKGLAEAMGGAIGVTSTPGEGSCFFFSLDAPRAEAALRPDGEAADAPGLHGVRILVVDDNPMNRELARAILEDLGSEVSEAADGLAAVEAAQLLPYDVILLDIRMPGLDGPRALARIRQEPGPNQDVPILAFSADVGLDRFEAHGFDGVVSKPLDPAALVAAIARALQWGPEDLEDADARVA